MEAAKAKPTLEALSISSLIIVVLQGGYFSLSRRFQSTNQRNGGYDVANELMGLSTSDHRFTWLHGRRRRKTRPPIEATILGPADLTTRTFFLPLATFVLPLGLVVSATRSIRSKTLPRTAVEAICTRAANLTPPASLRAMASAIPRWFSSNSRRMLASRTI
jgi:hypothetical protein